MEKAPELLTEPPKIEKADVLADRLPVSRPKPWAANAVMPLTISLN